MPRVRPRTSWAPLADLSQTPACIGAFLSVSRRASEMISAIASSTTLRVLENGALNTAMPALGRRGQVDLVGADAERADRQQVRRGLEHRRGDGGLGPDAEQVDAVEGGDQLVLVERALDRLDLDAPLGEQPHAVGVDVLQQ